METERQIKRSELFNEIIEIVKKHNDDLGYLEVSCDLENLFTDKMDIIFNDMPKFYEWAKQKCATDGRGNWQLITGGVIYNYSTKELYKDWKNNTLP